MTFAWALMLPLLLAAAPTLAKDTSDDQTIEATGKKPRTKLVCRADKWTGTRIARPICASAAEWAKFDEDQAAKREESLKTIGAGSATNNLPSDPNRAPQLGPNGYGY